MDLAVRAVLRGRGAGRAQRLADGMSVASGVSTATAGSVRESPTAGVASAAGSEEEDRDREREEDADLVLLRAPTSAGRVADAAAMAAARHSAAATGMSSGLGTGPWSGSGTTGSEVPLGRAVTRRAESEMGEDATMQLPSGAVAPMPPAAAVASALATSTHRYPATLVQHRVNKAMGWLP